MPVLKNARQEEFCHRVAEGESQTQAYINSGYSKVGAHGHSSRLVAVGIVASRIAEIKANITRIEEEKDRKLEQKVGVTRAWILEELQGVVNDSKIAPVNLSARNRALELMGKELGMFSDRMQVSGTEGGPMHYIVEGLAGAPWLPKPKSHEESD
jgi:hypothetical protein